MVAYLAREHGLGGLQSLIDSERYHVMQVFTHRKVPQSQEPLRPQRAEFGKFERMCESHGIPWSAIDRKRDLGIVDEVLENRSFHLNVSISWRYLIPPRHLELAALGGVNLHRGKLPEYAGAEPVRRMLIDGYKQAHITAHVLDPVLDSGRILEVATHPMGTRSGGVERNVERVKRELTPLFGPLLIRSLNKLVGGHE